MLRENDQTMDAMARNNSFVEELITRAGGPGRLRQEYLACARLPRKITLSDSDTVNVVATDPESDGQSIGGVIRLARIPSPLRVAIMHAFQTTPASSKPSTPSTYLDAGKNHLHVHIHSRDDLQEFVYPVLGETPVAEEVLGELVDEMYTEISDFLDSDQSNSDMPEELVDGLSDYVHEFFDDIVSTATSWFKRPPTGWVRPPSVTLYLGAEN